MASLWLFVDGLRDRDVQSLENTKNLETLDMFWDISESDIFI